MNRMPPSNMEMSRVSATNWGYTDFQLDCYRAMLVDFEKYVVALPDGDKAVRDERIRFIASMRMFCLSVQFLFYGYLQSPDVEETKNGAKVIILSDYHEDMKKYKWAYKITDSEYTFCHSSSFAENFQTAFGKAVRIDNVLCEMLSILNNWAQQYGCFKTFNEKIEYADFWDKIDAENA